MKRLSYKKDYVGLMYKIFDECGAFPFTPYGKLIKNQHLEWIFLPHYKFDGIGGLYDLLLKDGYFPEIPQNKKNLESPSYTKKLKAFIKLTIDDLKEAKKQTKIKWRHYNTAGAMQGKSCYISYFIFSAEETNKIILFSKSQNVSVNSFLLWTLNKVVNDHLFQGEQVCTWWIPMNMRGLVDPTCTGNIFSELKPILAPDYSIAMVHEQMNILLRKYAHWANWWQLNLIKFMGMRAATFMLQNTIMKLENAAGTFSNLGIWNCTKENFEEENWFFCPPVFSFMPVGAGCITWNGQLTLAVQLHHVLSNKPETTQNFMNEWLRQIITLIS